MPSAKAAPPAPSEEPKKPETLHFDVSSGLKSVLGRELITDEQVAIFELVKNSFDARAKSVHLHFGANSIVVADDGTGMSLQDIKEKWLLVAYSSKKGAATSADFRDEIADRKHYAGSKGIGRFSSDRLGETIHLQTRAKAEPRGPVHSVIVNWKEFDENHRERFESIEFAYTSASGFVLPKGLPRLAYGTVLTIGVTKRAWTRQAILDLKSDLAKLINPFGASADGFKIHVHAPDEKDADTAATAAANEKEEPLPPNALVNGEIGNFIFATLQEKTTFIDVQLSQDGTSIESTLTDRGELIYRIQEPNPYDLLKTSGFQCKLFFLNLSAKTTFTRRMGVPSVQFGSVFLFRNGFRVFPIGEEGNDWWGMDRRKQQGFRRFLGTRDVIGRVDVSGEDEAFQEASSRNTGLIQTAAVIQLRKFVQEHCLKRLEKYVVPVTFVDKEDKNTGDVSRLMTDPGRARVAEAVAKLVDGDGIKLLDYSKRLIGIVDEKSAVFMSSLTSLRAIALKTNDKILSKTIDEAEKKFEELRASEQAAHKRADEEQKAKEEAQARASAAERIATTATARLEEEIKRNLFLSSISTLDTDTILNLHHQVTIYAVDIQQQIENFLVKLAGQKTVASADVVNALERIALLNRKVMGVSKFATKANFRLQSEKIEEDLGSYIEQYINGVARDFIHGATTVIVESDGKGFSQKFKPIDVSVVVDNLITNARKARATQIRFDITHPSKSAVHIRVTDNGRGFNPGIVDLERIFEKGFTLTDGSGLGLYHVRQVLGEMGGTIEAMRGDGNKGAGFLLRISK